MSRALLSSSWVVCVLVFHAGLALGQEQPIDGRKQTTAYRVAGGTIRVDGQLDEEAWLRAAPITDFLQKEPTEGAAPTDQMEVRFVYDDTALYIGARMFTRVEPQVQAPLGRRDSSEQAENIQVWLDTYLDRRSASMFGVTASGVRLDQFHSNDTETAFDLGFDPVWQARTMVGPDAWTAELWIPFSQLRFGRQGEQVWGLNIRRFRPTLDEQDYWVVIPRTEGVFISHFGDLRGISDVRPTNRIELLPYLAQSSTVTGNRDRRNPFDDGSNLTSRVGADLKMGFGPNLTLQATVNPDFGQVEADPAEVNLTAFETRFPEKRPFFLEGAQLFTVAHPNFYYSRRIGTRPLGPASGDFVDYPSSSTILAAGKLTGRLPSKTSIGVISAAVDQEWARVANLSSAGSTTRLRVAPRGFYNVGRVRQEFGPLGSTVGFIVNYLHRNLGQGDPLADLLTKNALAYAGDTVLRFKGGEYEFRATGGGSYVGGQAKSIERFQRASSHYAQRPDRTYVRLDPTLTSLAGWSVQSALDRISGRHWLWGTSVKVDSESFETNDVANLNGADGLMINSNIQYRETRPGRLFRSYSIRLNNQNDFTLRGLRQSGSIRPSVNLTWANFWTSSISVSRGLRSQSVSLTRGGPLMGGPAGWTTTLNLGNRATSNTRWSGTMTIASNEDGGRTRSVGSSFSFRPGARWQLSAGPAYERLTEPQQYVQTVGGGRAETYGSRYVFAYIDRSTVSTEFRMGLTVKPDVNLDVYAEPFAASGRYYDFGELLTPGTRQRLSYGTAPGTSISTNADGTRAVTVGDQRFTLRSQDFNTLSFRSNVVLRWEWRPGSTLYLVWQMDRSTTEVLASHVGIGDMFGSLTAPGSNFFVIKTSFWLPIP
jgi:hypothetical protein